VQHGALANDACRADNLNSNSARTGAALDSSFASGADTGSSLTAAGLTSLFPGRYAILRRAILTTIKVAAMLIQIDSCRYGPMIHVTPDPDAGAVSLHADASSRGATPGKLDVLWFAHVFPYQGECHAR